MIAGRGIVHSEVPLHREGQANPNGLQLWIDLPKEHKLDEPSYQDLKADQIPSVHPSPDVHVKVICGTAEGSAEEGFVSSPVRPLGGCWFFDVNLKKKGAKFWQAIPPGWNAFVSHSGAHSRLCADSHLLRLRPTSSRETSLTARVRPRRRLSTRRC